MSIESVSGRSYGPFSFSTARAVVDRYVVATGDDVGRWEREAPRSLAGAVLFVVAPALLGDPDVAGRSVIHGEQVFTWARPIPLETELSVSGTVTRVRERGGVFFIGFELEVDDGDGPVIGGSSLFLMSGTDAPAGAAAEEDEPDVFEGPGLAPAVDAHIEGDVLPPLERGASRADLVRYAGASQDFNPIHWDHRAAVTAGLPGVVVHGLLQSAWLTQAVERCGIVPASARFRYRAPLRPGRAVIAQGARSSAGWDTALVSDDGTEHVVGAFTVA